MALNARSDRIRTSDMSATQPTLTQTAYEATHVNRLLGLVMTGDEAATLERLLEAGGLPARRLLVQKLNDLLIACAAIGLFGSLGGIDDPTDYDGGAEINALANYMSTLASGDSRNENPPPLPSI